MGGRPGNTLSIISTSPLPPAPDIWGLETLRRGLEDATGTGQALLRSANNGEADLPISDNRLGDYEDDFYTSGGALGSDRDHPYTSEASNDRESDKGVSALPLNRDPDHARSIARPPPVSRATTRSQSRTIRSQSPVIHSSALPDPLLLPITREPRSRSKAPAQEPLSPLSPLSPLQEDWLDGQSLFVSDAGGEGDGLAEDEASLSSADGRECGTPWSRRAHAPTGVYTRNVDGRDYAPSANESKYSTAAAWVQAQMLEEPVCEQCSKGLPVNDEENRLGLQGMATFIQDLGVPDALAGSVPVARDNQPWEEALTGGVDCPQLNMAKSHQPDPNLATRFDVDAFIAEATSFEALRGLRFSYHP